MEQGGDNSDGNSRVIHFADVQPQLLGQSEIEDRPLSNYLQVTGMNVNETVESNSLLGSVEPEFNFGVKDGLAKLGRIRGKSGHEIKPDEMVEQQDQALLEWKNIEFFVKVKKPQQKVLAP